MSSVNQIPGEVRRVLEQVDEQFGIWGSDLGVNSPAPQNSVDDSIAEQVIMLVDDEPINIKVAKKYLQEAGYRQFVSVTDPRDTMQEIERARPSVVLLDIMMPEVDGLTILKYIREREQLAQLPVVVLTASCDRPTKLKALELGATDFLSKPVDPAELLPRVRNSITLKLHHDHLKHYASQLEAAVERRTAELVSSRLEIVHCLAKAAEFRDHQTGRHVFRVGRYAGIIAASLSLPREKVHLIELAAQLHDVGKIGIPDNVLLKPGALSQDEYKLMQKHCMLGKGVFERSLEQEWNASHQHALMGAEMLGMASSPLVQMAARVALTHHERWDGSGYPLGLAGKDIPLEGRITAVADVFDALTSPRPYKAAFPINESFDMVQDGSGTHFDPEVVAAFFRKRDEIVEVSIRYADTE